MKVYDLQNKKEVELPSEEVASAVTSGKYALPKGMKIEVLSPDGERGTIDSTEAPNAFGSGFKYVSPEEAKQESLKKEYGTGIGDELAAGALGAARGLTFGLSDQVLEKTGLMSEEELGARKEFNPLSSLGGELAGTIAPVVLSGGSSVIAKGASKALPSLVQKGTEKIGEMAVKSLAKESTSKIVQNAIKMGVGSAVEGSLYGAGQLISEEALGNAEFNSESIMANVGMGALIGGTAGSAMGAAATIGSKYINKIKADIKSGNLKKYGITPKQSSDLIDNIDLASAKNSLGDIAADIEPTALASKTKDVEGITEASERLGIQPTRGMLSESPTFQAMESQLAKSDALAGQDIKQAYIDTFDHLQKATEGILEKGSKVTAADEGELIKRSLFESYNDRLSGYKSFMDDFQEQFSGVAVNDRMRKLAKTRFLKAGEAAFDDTEIQRAVGYIDKIDTVKKAKEAKSFAYNEMMKMKRSGDMNAFKVWGDFYDTAGRMIENAAVSSVKGLRNQKKLVEGLRTSNKIYAGLANDMKDVAKAMGKKINRPSEVVDFIESLSSSEVAHKLSKVKNNDMLDTLREKFPSVYDNVINFKTAEIMKKSQDSLGAISPKKFLNLVKDFEPEDLTRLFGEKVQTIDDVKKVLSAIPQDINPSGTARALETMGLPTLGTQTKALALRKLYSDTGEGLVNYYDKTLKTLRGVEDYSNKIKLNIAGAVESFITKSSRTANPVIASSTDLGEDFNKAKKQIEEIEGNPDADVLMFAEKNKELFESAPNTATALSSKLTNAVAFLNQKMPKRPVVSPYSVLEPSKREKEKFMRYYNAVQDPKSVLESVKKGYANPEGVEALRKVYPEIYQTLSEEIYSRLKDGNLSYQDKVNLQKLLGISANYKKPASVGGNKPKTPSNMLATNGKTRLGGVKMLDQAGRNATNLERVMNR